VSDKKFKDGIQIKDEDGRALSAMEVLARASYYVPELVRGKPGEFEISEDGWGQGGYQAALAELHNVQRALIEAGWRRDKEKEQHAPYSHNIEVACYRKQFKVGKPSKWVYVTVATRFGLTAKFQAGTFASLSW